MVFSSVIFLFAFLPLILALYYISPKGMKNTVLLIGSLTFYAWGEKIYVLIMVVSILVNYGVGRLISFTDGEHPLSKVHPKLFLAAGIIVNLSFLGVFKYTNFLVEQVNVGLIGLNVAPIVIPRVHLPIGISFFTFQAISYLVDVYRKEVRAQRNILHLALFISLFPQLIAGPIIRYKDIVSQIVDRFMRPCFFTYSIQRFVFGLSKKMLIANPLGELADKVFALPAESLSTVLVWPAIFCYTLQIYFDFSGYSDMAIGLGGMFGFKFKENFNYPYVAKSIRDFWRRWHISLSTWFRDYLYIPLGGDRCTLLRLYVNLWLVFFLCGLWHGASWNFIVWGAIHGCFIVLERIGFSKILDQLWAPVQIFYTMAVVIVGWVFFRSDTIAYALDYLEVMFNPSRIFNPVYPPGMFFTHEILVALCVGTLFCTPVYRTVKNGMPRLFDKANKITITAFSFSRIIIASSLLFLSILKVSSSTYNPFIYFRF